MSPAGRKRQELTTKRKRELERALAVKRRAEERLREAEVELSRVASDALEDGASTRALAEALGFESHSGALKLARRGI